jgi:hypothetical protein
MMPSGKTSTVAHKSVNVYNFSEYIMTFLIFALSQNGARRNDVFNCFPFSSANPTFVNDRLQTAYVIFIISSNYVNTSFVLFHNVH